MVDAGGSSVGVKTEADCAVITVCPQDDKPLASMFGFSCGKLSAFVYLCTTSSDVNLPVKYVSG